MWKVAGSSQKASLARPWQAPPLNLRRQTTSLPAALSQAIEQSHVSLSHAHIIDAYLTVSASQCPPGEISRASTPESSPQLPANPPTILGRDSTITPAFSPPSCALTNLIVSCSEAWRYTGPFSRANRLRGAFPGFGIAVVAFAGYMVYEQLFVAPAHAHGESVHGEPKPGAHASFTT